MAETPSHIGRYPVQRELGRGGMGVVYLATDPKLGRPVAIKVLPQEVARDPDWLLRFEREAKALASLNHPNIAIIHSLEESEDGSRFLVLEMVEGPSLAERLKAQKLPVEETLQVCLQIARALEAAHEIGLVHRDLKPENVKITPGGLVKVLDFGLARKEGELPLPAPGRSSDLEMTATVSMLTGTGWIMGTPGYMSPEQARGETQDRRTDVFSFGCVFYECLAGSKAFPGETVHDRISAVLQQEPDWSLLGDSLPVRIRDLLLRCLEKDPGQRTLSIGAARMAIERAQEDAAAAGRRPAVASRTPNNLPATLTSFVGRETEVAEVKRLLGSVSLLTLTGVGGCGKTRLALKVAGELLDENPGGVWLVELAALEDPALVPSALAVAIGVRDQPGRTVLQSVVEFLQGRMALILLDNCEHLLAACGALVHELLRNCPDLRILATTREALGASGESVWQVPSLSLRRISSREGRGKAALQELMRSDAVRLFVERAGAARPGFTPTAENAPVVLQICRRLDGIPLAIELAAARVRVLSIQQIEEKLSDRFRLLRGGSRTALERHQTLRGAIDWSYGLLSEEEKRWLQDLSVFAGGCSLFSAQEVCGAGSDEFEALEMLTRLVEKSLILAEEGGEDPRYRLLETVRQFAREELERAGRMAPMRERHCGFYLTLVEKIGPKLWGADQALWLRRLEDEHENLLSALQWCGTSEGGSARALEICKHLWWFWYVRGHFSLGRGVLEEALRREGVQEPTTLRASALSAAGVLASAQGDYPAARAWQGESLAISRALEDRPGVARSLNNLGLIATGLGELAEARALHEESLAIRREQADRANIAISLNNLGSVASAQGDYTSARDFYEESIGIQRELGNRNGVAILLGNLGLVAQRQGNYQAARAAHEESLSVHRELGNQAGIARSLNSLGDAAYCQGDHFTAKRFFEESLSLRREQGDRHGIADSLNNLGNVAFSLNDQEQALALFEESLAINRELGNRRGTAILLANLGRLAGLRGDSPRACALLLEGLSLRVELGDKPGIASSLEAAGQVAATAGEARMAAHFFAGAKREREEIGAPLPLHERAEQDQTLAGLRDLLGPVEFDRSWQAGLNTEIAETVEEAQGWLRGGAAEG